MSEATQPAQLRSTPAQLIVLVCGPGENAPVSFSYVDIKPPSPPAGEVGRAVLFPVKKRSLAAAPASERESLFPRSKERRTRMAPCRAAC